MVKIEPGQIWTHKNGKCFRVLHLATRNDTDEEITSVIHVGEDGRIWDRTLENFTEPGRFTDYVVER